MRQSQLALRVHAERNSQTPALIARAALRDAAMASTPNDALDVAGAALRRIAELSRSEASNG